MIPSYHLKHEKIIGEMFEKALKETPNAKSVYIHKKSLKKSQVTEYKEWFKNKSINIISSKELINLN